MTIPCLTISTLMKASSHLNTIWLKRKHWMYLSFDRSDTAIVPRTSSTRPLIIGTGMSDLIPSNSVTYQCPHYRYCEHVCLDPATQWKSVSDSDETIQFLYGFFGWRCDIRRGKNGRHCPGIRYKSSLESFWKWWHLSLKQRRKSGLVKETIVKIQDVST